MIIIIAQIVFGLSIIGILVIVLRKIPIILRYPRQPFEETTFFQSILNVWKKMRDNSFMHETALPETEKTLRRIKIIVLKFDNFLAKLVSRLRHRRKNIEEKLKNENDGENMNLPS